MSCASQNGEPTSWAPTGRPSSVQCTGRLIAGRPVMLANTVKATMARTASTGSPGLAWACSRTEPTGGGRMAVVGVTSTSNSAPQADTRARLKRSSVRAAAAWSKLEVARAWAAAAGPALGPARDAPRARAEAAQAAARRRDADRPAAVGGVRHREHPRRHRGRRAAAGAARRAVEVPRVARRAVAQVLRDRERAELGRVGAPAQHEARAPERLRGQLALGADARGAAARAVGHRPARHRREVLDRDRHAEERRVVTAGQRLVGMARGVARRVVIAPDDRVDIAVARVDRLQAGVQQLDGGQLAAAQRGGELEGGGGRLDVHGAKIKVPGTFIYGGAPPPSPPPTVSVPWPSSRRSSRRSRLMRTLTSATTRPENPAPEHGVPAVRASTRAG